MDKVEVITFLSDVGFGTCLGIIVDTLVKTDWIFTCIGIALGIVLAVILRNARKRKENDNDRKS